MNCCIFYLTFWGFFVLFSSHKLHVTKTTVMNYSLIKVCFLRSDLICLQRNDKPGQLIMNKYEYDFMLLWQPNFSLNISQLQLTPETFPCITVETSKHCKSKQPIHILTDMFGTRLCCCTAIKRSKITSVTFTVLPSTRGARFPLTLTALENV